LSRSLLDRRHIGTSQELVEIGLTETKAALESLIADEVLGTIIEQRSLRNGQILRSLWSSVKFLG
jgi:hypothetical protein